MYEMRCDVAIIGGGPAGLSAAVAARKEGAGNVLIIERDESIGGILQQLCHIHAHGNGKGESGGTDPGEIYIAFQVIIHIHMQAFGISVGAQSAVLGYGIPDVHIGNQPLHILYNAFQSIGCN